MCVCVSVHGEKERWEYFVGGRFVNGNVIQRREGNLDARMVM